MKTDIEEGLDKYSILCKICGLPEEDHHQFTPIIIPKGCTCDLFSWDTEDMDTLPYICSKYESTTGKNCIHCEHNRECHKEEE